MLWIDRLRDIRDGSPLRGFFVRNRRGKVVAVGVDRSFVQAAHVRYERDNHLMETVARLTGMQPREIPKLRWSRAPRCDHKLLRRRFTTGGVQ